MDCGGRCGHLQPFALTCVGKCDILLSSFKADCVGLLKNSIIQTGGFVSKKNKYADKVARRNKERSHDGGNLEEKETSLQPIVAEVSLRVPVISERWANHFCAGVVVRKIGALWYVAGVTDSRYPTEVKLPGGTNSDDRRETDIDTLRRELQEEIGIEVPAEPSACQRVCRCERHGGHIQYFFFVRSWYGDWKSEPFADNSHIITPRTMTLADFWPNCFEGHREPFQKAVRWIAREKATTEPDFAEQARAAGIIQ